MVFNPPGYVGNEYFQYAVPDLMNDPNYLRELNRAVPRTNPDYYNHQEFNEDYSDNFLSKGLMEMVKDIENMDSYKYTNLTEACDLFEQYLIELTRLKDYLLPNKDGVFSDKWVLAAMQFQKGCEEVFLKYVKEEYIMAFLPLVPKQLKYTSEKIEALGLMTVSEMDDFKNLFSLIALGFIGKLKLLSFYLSLTVIKGITGECLNPEIETNNMDLNESYDSSQSFSGIQSYERLQNYDRCPIYERNQDYDGNSTRFEPCYSGYGCNTNQTTLTCDGFYSDKYQNYEFKPTFGDGQYGQGSQNYGYREPYGNRIQYINNQIYGNNQDLESQNVEEIDVYGNQELIYFENKSKETNEHKKPKRKRGRPRKFQN